MVYLVINVIVSLLLIIFFKKSLVFLLAIDKENNRKKEILDNAFLKLKENIDIHNQSIRTFDNFTKNNVYEIALCYLKLKFYQQELVKSLDPYLDHLMIDNLIKTNEKIDDILMEMSFLSKINIKSNKKDLSIIKEVFFEENGYSKN
jgi:hypothetical protein